MIWDLKVSNKGHGLSGLGGFFRINKYFVEPVFPARSRPYYLIFSRLIIIKYGDKVGVNKTRQLATNKVILWDLGAKHI